MRDENMNSQGKIEVNQSSLLSLKAELQRKRQEVHDAKLSEYPNRPTPIAKTKLKIKADGTNEGVSERNKKDIEELEAENDIFQRSQSALEAKSELYNELLKNPKNAEDLDNLLVDFKNKEKDREKEETDKKVDESDEDDLNYDYGDDDEWVDFVDCLGRTKRCHRDDLESMKASDNKLRLTLFGAPPNRDRDRERDRDRDRDRQETRTQNVPKTAEELELCSDDMRRKMMREKWEKEEQELLDRKDIHYQHVLFGEARTHGVGYYNFSTDEAERVRQMKEFDDLRKETAHEQAVTKEAARRKKKQMEERLRAARRRKRERLGLPPEEEAPEVEEEEEEKPKPEELKREVHTPKTVRPWDIGKVKTRRVLTQEEWVEKRREERPKEFAPMYPRERSPAPRKTEKELPDAYLEDISPPVRKPTVKNDEEFRGKGGIEVPPTPDLYCSLPKRSKHQSRPDLERSVEEGLNFIRKQLEENQAKETKALFADSLK